MITAYIKRWFLTGKGYLVKNVFFAFIIFFLTWALCHNGVFNTFKDTQTFFFAYLMCNVWIGLFNSILMYYDESSYVNDDISKFLPTHSYIIANLIIQSFLCIIEAFIATFVIKVKFGYSEEGLTVFPTSIEYGITFFFILVSADMLGMILGIALSKKVNTIMAAVPLVLIIQFLLSGCLIDLPKKTAFLADYTTAKWGFNALGTISNLNSFLPGMEKSAFEYVPKTIYLAWIWLAGIAAICIVLAGLFLYVQMNSKSDNN